MNLKIEFSELQKESENKEAIMAARCPTFGLTAYGRTRELAFEALTYAMYSFASDLNKTQRLKTVLNLVIELEKEFEEN